MTGTFPVTTLKRLQNVYGVSRKCARAILKKQHEQTEGDFDVVSILEILKKWNLDLERVRRYPQILRSAPYALDHHKHILEECGIGIGVSSLAGYLKLNRSFLFALESHGVLPPGYDVIGGMCETVDMPHEVVDSVRSGLDSVQSRQLQEVRLAVFRRYLCQRLDCDEAAAQRMVTCYPRNKHKSLRLTARVLDLLETQQFTADKIVRNAYLLNTHPEQLGAVLENCPTVAETDVTELIQRVPRIAYMPWDNTAQIVSCLREFGFSEKALLLGAEVFTLSAETVGQRLQLMSEIPELWAMRHNKYFLKTVYSFQRTLGRIAYMRSVNMRCMSVHLLSSFYPQFRRYVSTGEDNSGGCDMVTFLSERLAAPTEAVWRQMRRHPFWRSVPLPSVSETTDALLEAGFSPAQLRHAMQLCLYPARRAVPAARQAASEADRAAVPHQYLLQLALYRLERDSHFSGTVVFEFGAERRAPGATDGVPAFHEEIKNPRGRARENLVTTGIGQVGMGRL